MDVVPCVPRYMVETVRNDTKKKPAMTKSTTDNVTLGNPIHLGFPSSYRLPLLRHLPRMISSAFASKKRSVQANSRDKRKDCMTFRMGGGRRTDDCLNKESIYSSCPLLKKKERLVIDRSEAVHLRVTKPLGFAVNDLNLREPRNAPRV